MIHRNYTSISLRALALLLLACGTACNPASTGGDTNGDNNGNNDTSTTGLTVVRTSLKTTRTARVIGGDGIIVFGNAEDKGVAYTTPSGASATAQSITDGDRFDNTSFAVIGKKIALIDRQPRNAAVLDNGQLTIFDTATGASSPIPLTEVNLIVDAPAGGNFVATLSNDFNVTDGHPLKVVDISGSTPAVIAFTQYVSGLPGTTGGIDEFAVDPTLSRVVAVAGDLLLVYDIKNPTAAPVQFDTTTSPDHFLGIDSRRQITADNGMVLFEERTSSNTGRAIVLNTATGVYKPLSSTPCSDTSPLALRGNLFAFFTNENAASDFRAGYGRLTDAATTFANVQDTVVPGTFESGTLGFGRTCDVTKDGKQFFIAGSGAIDFPDEHVQVSTGGKFALLSDPTGEDTHGVLGTDIDCSGSVVVFKSGKAGFSSDLFVTYIK